MNKQKISILDFSLDEIAGFVKELGQPSFRAKQIWTGLYQQLRTGFDDFPNLPKALITKLEDSFHISTLHSEVSLKSSDGQTEKTLFKLNDGNFVETVLMKYKDRNTICVSSQVGCPLNCSFCATGKLGFTRDLTVGEMVDQILHYQRKLLQADQHITNIVYMGMGEPLLNFDNVFKSIDILNHKDGMNLGERRFTVSTAGLVPEINKFTDMQRQINLAVSLHAAEDEERSSLMPINQKYPIHEVINACRYYTDNTRRRITCEMALIQDVNDTPRHAHQLADLLQNMLCHVNVIPLNPISGTSLKGSGKNNVSRYCNILEKAHIPCSIRLRRGIDIQAGCGQLAAKIRTDQSDSINSKKDML